MFVVSIDPGLGTGVATYNTITGVFATSEDIGFEKAAQHIEWLLADHFNTEVVCENYIVTQRTGTLTQQPEPLMLIGVAQWYAYKYRHKFTLQQPSQRKAGEKLLKKIDWYTKTKDGHSNSAAGHLLVYCLSNNLLRPDEKAKLITK